MSSLLSTERPTGKLQIVCTGFKPVRKNTLRGFCTLRIPALRFQFHEVAVHERGERRWIAMPSRPMLQDGIALKDDAGKVRYSPPLIEVEPPVRSAFSDAAVEAVAAFEPSAFEGGEP